VRIPEHEGVGGHAGVDPGVGDLQDVVGQPDDVLAERLLQGEIRFLGREAEVGLEPLSIVVEERHQGDRGAADLGRQGDDPVEVLLGTRVGDARVVDTGDGRGRQLVPLLPEDSPAVTLCALISPIR
jgi:hypothetical protein